MIASANGITIGYDDVGIGLPVIFIHGFPHDRTLWGAQLGALAAPVRTLACDLRGFGQSTGVASSIDDFAADVDAWMRALGIQRGVIAGLSMGGYVAFALWRRNPALVRALILADTRAGADDPAGRARRDDQIALVRARGVAPLADQMMTGMVGKTTRAERADVFDGMHAMLTRAPVEGVVGALTALRDRPDSTPTMATITVPTLIVVGEEDALTPVAESRAMHASIRGSRLEIIERAGHVSNVERPAAFNHIVSEFLAALTAS